MTRSTPVTLRPGRPLAPMQRPLWMSQLRHRDAPMQNMALLVHIDGSVDIARLRAAFEDVVSQCDVLRTRIVDEGGVPGVRLAAAAEPTEILDLSRDEAQAWADERVKVPIDMSRCGYDSVVVRHSDRTVSWYLALHHTITDATSSALVFAATAAAYRREPFAGGSYYDWVSSLDNTGNARFDRAVEHWQHRPTALGVGRLYEPAGHPSPLADRLGLTLGAGLLEAAESRLATDFQMISEDLGWSALLLTLAAAYMHRVSGAEAFSLGLPVHNRSTKGARSLVGPLMEVFPVDVEVGHDDTFATLHRRVSRSLMVTLRHAIAGTAPKADYEAVVNVIPRAGVGAFGDWATTTAWIHAGAVDSSHLFRFQLTNYGAGDIEMALDLNCSVAGDAHLQRAPEHVLGLLRAMLDDPDSAIAAPSMCTASELQVLQQWEVGPPGPDSGLSIVDLLRVGLKSNSRVALEDGNVSFTGTELWDHAVATARWMRDHGVGVGVRVAVDLARSSDAVIAILGTLLAGGSYVPLDPSQPDARRTRLADRAGCALVLTSLPRPGMASADLDIDWDGPSPDDEAYLLFTSGSTGEPKGVPVSHLGLANYLQFAVDSYVDPNVPVVAPLFSALTFDLTVTSLFLPLVARGRSIVIRNDGPGGLAEVAERTDVTWCKATPSHLEILARLWREDHEPATLVVGGEAFAPKLARKLWRSRVFNEYGPTEAVVGCMIHEVEQTEVDRWAEVPIGRPAPGVALRVVDSSLNRVPIGSPGELCISHAGLTVGYLDADSRGEGPFVQIDGARFYRSGDLVRMVDDQTLVYLGRIDEQVKVGGIRLDPIEVEQVLESHPGVARAAVRLWSPTGSEASRHCIKCGLPSNVPGVGFDDAGVCDTCHSYEQVAPAAASWFKTPADLAVLRDQIRLSRTGEYDCLHLLSGGKDSTYALYQLVEMGFEPYVLTLDNGFISTQALDNVRRSMDDLGLDYEIATSDAMDAIFRDSLQRHSNVCNGCYKAIYTLATTRAVELGIPAIVTGLSRGQLFETRLIPQQFSHERFDPDAIDRAVIEARKAYHRVDDAAGRLLDTSVFESDDLFDRLAFVDFYRYVDVELAEMFSYLDDHAPWVRPSDTGRSTNCLINAAGIHTHKTEQGYHNYAVPYAWDVRLGHKTRTEAIEELNDELDMAEVDAMLATVGYEPSTRQVLTAWLELAPGTDQLPPPGEFRTFLGTTLPSHFIPAAFVAVDALPMAKSGKLDVSALPTPTRVHRAGPAMYVSPQSPLEASVIAIWEQVLGIEPIGLEDDFFAVGGDSLAALEMVVAVSEQLDKTIAEELAFLHTTPRRLAAAIELSDSQSGTEPAPGPPPSAVTFDEPPPLSVGEQSILYAQKSSPDSTNYNVGHLYRVGGPVDARRFAAALRDVAQAHVPLSWSYGSPRRHLAADDAVHVDMAADAIDETSLAAVAQSVHREHFDLDNGPLLRCLVQPLEDGTTAVVLAVHHVSGDAQSLTRLWSQTDAVYGGGSVPQLGTNYPDFCAWQREQADEGHRDFWAAQSSVAPATLAIHAPQSALPDGFIRQSASFDPGELRAGSGATGFGRALAALGAVLARYTRGDRVGIGVVASTRNHPAADQLAGYFLNTLPIELDCPVDATLAELGSNASATIGASLGHRVYPLADIVADRRSVGQHLPAVNVLLAFDDLVSVRLGMHSVTHDVLFNGSAVADLTFFVEVQDNRVDLSVEYRGSVVDEAVARQLLDDFDAMLGHAIGSPSAPTAELPLPSDATSKLTGPALGSAPSLIETILAQVEARGSLPAVSCGGTTLSWRDLGHRSAVLAGQLQAASVGPGDRVVVFVPRSVDLIVSILAVLRSGASYVPIDPTYPDARVNLIAEMAGATVALVAAEQPQLTSNDIVVGSTMVGRTDFGSDQSPTPGDEAYVMFTSGSTGTPRGVPVTHAQLGASTAARYQAYQTHPGRFLLLSSAAFDSSVAGLFWTLSNGGELVLPTEAEAHDADALLALFQSSNITHTLLVPTLYQALLDRSGAQRQWPGLVIAAGEACPSALVRRHHELHPESVLINEYGPTEATVWATSHRCVPDGAATVPIGLPIPGTWVDVVDEEWLGCPSGVEGELVVGGEGLVDGYVGDAEATRSRFGVRETGDRFFKTGDRAVVRDGLVFFVGRADDQLNIGGVRAEPTEIERVICQHPAVGAAIVTAFDPRSLRDLMSAASTAELRTAMIRASSDHDPAGALADLLRESTEPDWRIVAHVEPSTAGVVDVEALRKQTEEHLPPLLAPSTYVVHAALPLSPNGKLDRQAANSLDVPWPAESQSNRRMGLGGGHGADPDVVASVVALFGEILGRSAAADDSFFELGGHSLLALRLLHRLEESLGVELSVAALYESPTPIGIAKAIPRADPSAGKAQYLVPVQTQGDRPPIFGLHVLGLNAAFYRPLSERLGPNQPVFGLGLTSSASDMTGPRTVRGIAVVYADELERCAPSGPVGLAAVSMGSIVAVEVASELVARGRQVAFVGLFDAAGPDAQQFLPTRVERLRLHLNGLRRTPVLYASARFRFLGLRIARRAGQTELAIRKAVGASLPDRAKLREFVEANIDSAVQHQLAPYAGRITIFKAADDPFSGSLKDNAMGWADVALGGVEVVEVAGGHTSMLEEPHVAALAAEIERALDAGIEAGGGLVAGLELGLADVESDLRRALHEGRFCPAVAQLSSSPGDLGAQARHFVDRADAALRSTASDVRSEADRVVSALSEADIAAVVDQAPDRLQHASFAVTIDADPDVALAALFPLGYFLQDPLSPGAWRAFKRDHCSCMLISQDAATTRLDLRWGHESAPTRFARATRPTRSDLLAISVPGWAWPAYSLVRPVRIARDRLTGVRGGGDLGVFLGTPTDMIGPVLDLANPAAGELVVDLGCGDGRVLIEAAHRYGCRGRGVELDPALVRVALANVEAAGLSDQIEIVQGDAAKMDVSDAQVVFAFLPAESTGLLLDRVLQQLSAAARFVTHEQVAATWPIAPNQSQLVVEGGITVAHVWKGVKP